MTPLDKFYEWLSLAGGAAGYVPSRGDWVERSSNAGQRLVAMRSMGGRAPGVIQRYLTVQVWVVGKRDERNVQGALQELEAFADSLVILADETPWTDTLAQIRPMGDIMGPVFTAENRPVYSVSFELIL